MSGPLVAIDLGATSGRVIVGRVSPNAIEFEEVHRFANDPVQLPDGLHWNITELYRQIVVGLSVVARSFPSPLSIGIDSWGVDYGLVDKLGRLVSIPYHYRDERTARGVELVDAKIPMDKLYDRTGLQFLPFNTIYQLAHDQATGMLGAAETVLLMPDLLGYWLTGERLAEATNASTTGLMGVRSHDWDGALIERLGLGRELFPNIKKPGTVAGPLLAQVAEDAGLSASAVVTLVGSHDTASAFAGVPSTERPSAFVSCGTWALVGLELDAPVISEAARSAGFTNELGVDDKTRFLHNVMGMWLLEECLRDWRSKDKPASLQPLLDAASDLPAGGPTIDPNSQQFFAPGAMPDRIVAACRETGQAIPQNPAQVVRCVIDSLARAFAETVHTAEELSGRRVEVIHVVGGGSRNELLCRLTAEATGLPVLAGPAESAALGNLLVQARAHGLIEGSLVELRSLIRATQQIKRYEPVVAVSAH